jgi:predicted nucleotidyltransferase
VRQQQIFQEIQALKRQILPNEKMILFGSQARGDAREDSDWDLLVLLDKEKSDFHKDYDNYANPFAELGFKYGAYISAKVYTVNEWNSNPSIFRHNVELEGIEVK